MSENWSWIWPTVGPNPINQGLESEMFDGASYPYSETFVREAIQNSLDARLNPDDPVVIRFNFHEDKLGKRANFLKNAFEFRQRAGLSIPLGWSAGKINWITVEDSNTKGLLGDLNSRTGDFWGYWLNFGLSNKTGTGRGGRGIGRVTFLIASRMHTVLGLTRRSTDHALAACGMAVLKAGEYSGDFKSTHAYLAACEQGSIYTLHQGQQFHNELEEAFDLTRYSKDSTATGLSLVIPYPHDELTEDGILAAAIDHFAPAILNGSLVVEAGVDRLDRDSINTIAPCPGVLKEIRSPASKGVGRYLEMIRAAQAAGGSELNLSNAKLADQRDTEVAKELRAALANGGEARLRLRFSLTRNGVAIPVSMASIVRPAPYGKPPLDRLFREGMALPDVRSTRPGELDLILLVEDVNLAQYLNFCEGKAHLDLLESKEVKEKLAKEGFDGVGTRRLVKSLPTTLRDFLTDEKTEPDTSVWDRWFSVPEPNTGRKTQPKPRKHDPEPVTLPPPPLPPANVSAVIVETLPDGFRLRPNQQYAKYPAQVDVVIAYADGSARPRWSEFDFRPGQLQTTARGCEHDYVGNRLAIRGWTAASLVEVTGFDTRRELDTRIRTQSHASQD